MYITSRFKKIFLPLLLSILLSFDSFSQITLVKDGRVLSRIVLLDNDTTDVKAANLLQDFVYRISNSTLPIVKGGNKPGDIFIGGKSLEAGEDGFTIRTNNNQLFITSGGDKGSIYGVVTLLEQYMGVSYYAYNYYKLTKSNSITLPVINRTETPAFRFRNHRYYGSDDPICRYWFRLEEQKEIFAGGFCHTVSGLVPPKIYGKTHPEYYALIEGKRRPESMIQLCVSNPDLVKVVGDAVESRFKAYPGKNFVSVSQGDGTTCYCHCDECDKIYKEEGAISGAYVRFLNKLAERFPDKTISTLAYQFTEIPPQKVKPLPNVNFLLCNINCNREVPMKFNATGRDFLKNLSGWSKISNNIFIWDYGINCDNYISPFPNFHILQKNLQTFKENNVDMYMLLANGGKGVDFVEMRAYMISKLMWNPYQNADSLMRTFMDGYYGAASPYIYQYHKLLEGALLSSGIPLRLYDSPVSHKTGMLNDNLCRVYDELYDKAEQAVREDTVCLNHVRMSRLSLIYPELEIMRTRGNIDVEKARKLLDIFESRCEKFGIERMNEGGTKPSTYCKNYRKRYLSSSRGNKALGSKVIWKIPPTGIYRNIADTAMTDGLFGGNQFTESWVGWEGSDGSFVLDLGSEKEISSVETDFLHSSPRWIFLPHGVTYSVSLDGTEFQPFGEYKFMKDYRGRETYFDSGKVEIQHPVKARYIKVDVDAWGNCPDWHAGVGSPGWFFIDEITVL